MDEPQEPPRSSVQISVNAKGARQWAVKIYADSEPQSVEDARDLAVQIDQSLAGTYGLPG